MSHAFDLPDADWSRARPAFGERAVRREAAGLSVSVVDFPGAGRTRRHSHESAGLTLILAGAYAKTIGRHTHACAPGIVTCEPPDVTHAETYHADTQALLVEVAPSRFAMMAEIAPALGEPALTRHRAVVRAAQRTRREFLRTDAASTLALESAVLEWAVALARRPIAARRPRQPAAWLARVEQRLADDWRRTPALAELAALADVHPAYLARAFRARHGCSVGEFLRRRRVAWAAAALATTDDSLASIAQCTGFCDQSHFTRVFTRLIGLAPSAYRRLRHSPE